MQSIPLVICERTGEWAEAIRRIAERLVPEAISLVELRSPAECRKHFAEPRATSAGVPLVVELTPGGAADVCDLLARHVRRFGDAPRMVVAERAMAGYEATVREAGATLFVASMRDVRPCVAEYLRFRDDPSHLPIEDERKPTERFRDSLPWRPVRDVPENVGG